MLARHGDARAELLTCRPKDRATCQSNSSTRRPGVQRLADPSPRCLTSHSAAGVCCEANRCLLLAGAPAQTLREVGSPSLTVRLAAGLSRVPCRGRDPFVAAPPQHRAAPGGPLPWSLLSHADLTGVCAFILRSVCIERAQTIEVRLIAGLRLVRRPPGSAGKACAAIH